MFHTELLQRGFWIRLENICLRLEPNGENVKCGANNLGQTYLTLILK